MMAAVKLHADTVYLDLSVVETQGSDCPRSTKAGALIEANASKRGTSTCTLVCDCRNLNMICASMWKRAPANPGDRDYIMYRDCSLVTITAHVLHCRSHYAASTTAAGRRP